MGPVRLVMTLSLPAILLHLSWRLQLWYQPEDRTGGNYDLPDDREEPLPETGGGGHPASVLY